MSAIFQRNGRETHDRVLMTFCGGLPIVALNIIVVEVGLQMRLRRSVETDGYKKLKFKLGLALSGGGARGLAHIGVFKAFEEEHIRFDYVTGTSVGSIFGALYAAGISVDSMMEQCAKVKQGDILNGIFKVNSDSQNIANVANRLLNHCGFADLKTPFSAVAVDIVSGDEIVLDSGDVATAVAASSAVPVIFKPMRIGERVLVDGGLLNNMPADVCRRMGAEVVIGVDLNHARGKGTASDKLLPTALAVWNITTKGTMYKGYYNSDFVITPELACFKRTDLDNLEQMVDEGYRATKQAMPEIKKLLCIK